MRRLLYANLVTRTPASRDGSTVDFPSFLAGEQATFGLRYLDDVAGSLVAATLDVVSIRAGVGRRDARPERGTWALKVGSGSSTSANTTPSLPYNASPQAVVSALNALTGGTEDYEASFDGQDYLIRRTGGEAFTVSGEANALDPTSFVRVRTFLRDGATIHRVSLVQAPVVFTDSFDLIVPPSPRIVTVRDGGTDPSDTYFWNEIQELQVPADFRGTYQLKRGFARTRLLDLSDGPEEIQEALNAILAAEGGSVLVTNPQAQRALIEFRGDLAGSNLDPLEVTVFSAPAGDPTFVLDFNTQEVFRELADEESVDMRFEVEVDARIVPGDTESGTRTIKLWNVPVTVARPVNWEGLAAAQNIDWLRPPGPRNYIPFTLDQVLTGQQQAFSVVIGDTTATEFVIDHNLDSELCQVVVRENIAGGRLLRPDEYEVTFDNSNSLTLTMDVVPEDDALAVFVVAIGPASVFQSHTHTIEQIDGLEALLDNLGERLETVEGALAVTGSGAAASEWSGNIILPAFADVFPAAIPRGTGDKARVLLPPLPRALKDATPTDIAVAELPEAATVPGSVYVWDETSEAYIPGSTLRRGRVVTSADAPALMSDGYFWWLAKEGPADVFYPTELDRVLWELSVSPQLLAPGRRLRIDWAFLVALVAERPELRGTYMLRVRKGAPAAEDFDGAPNIEGIAWDEDDGDEELLFEQRITLTRAGISHAFAVEVARDSEGALTASKTLYGKTTSATPPQSTDFILRAELSRFDLTNYSEPMGLPVGQVYLVCGEAEGDAADLITKRYKRTDESSALTLRATIS